MFDINKLSKETQDEIKKLRKMFKAKKNEINKKRKARGLKEI